MAPVPAVFVGLGSNVGDREGTLARARQMLEGRGFAVTAASSLYVTEPVGGPPQGWFVNQVLGGSTTLGPEELLRACLAVEAALGRRRSVRHGPRTLDLDLLLHGQEVRATPELTLPHPRLPERRFVLVPLCEIAPHARHPTLEATVEELLRRCPDRSRVERLPAPAGSR